MNIEEKIKKKEKRRKNLKRFGFPIILVIVVIAIILLVIIMKNKKQNTENQMASGDNDKKTTVAMIIGNNKWKYDGYVYDYDYSTGLNKYKENEEMEAENSWSETKMWIHKDKVYLETDTAIKVFNLDGTNEQSIIVNDMQISNVNFDTNKEIFYLIYRDYDTQSYETKDCGICAVDLAGNIVKKISVNIPNTSLKILDMDDTNLYYSIVENGVNKTYEEQVKVILASLNKETFESKELKVEEFENLINGGYEIGEVKNFGDYLYYVIGSTSGTIIGFDGKICCIKKDGTEYKELVNEDELSSEKFYFGVKPELTISNGYLYFDEHRVDLQNNEVMPDEFKNGDIIDEDNYVYTVSLSDEKTVILAKYKVGTQHEKLEKIFSKEIEDGLNTDVNRMIIEWQEDNINLTIPYFDNETMNWRPVEVGSDTYCMKKDGTEVKLLGEK